MWLGRDIAGYAVNRALGVRDNLSTPIQSMLENIIEPAANAAHAGASAMGWLDDGYELPERWTESAVTAGGMFAGIPRQTLAPIFNFIDFLQGEGDLTWRDLLSRRSKN